MITLRESAQRSVCGSHFVFPAKNRILNSLRVLLGHSTLDMVKRYPSIVQMDFERDHEKALSVKGWNLQHLIRLLFSSYLIPTLTYTKRNFLSSVVIVYTENAHYRNLCPEGYRRSKVLS